MQGKWRSPPVRYSLQFDSRPPTAEFDQFDVEGVNTPCSDPPHPKTPATVARRAYPPVGWLPATAAFTIRALSRRPMRPLKMPVPLAPGPAPAGRAGSNRWALLAAGRLLLGGQAREAGLAGKGLVGHGGRARLCRLLRLWTRVHALQKGAKEGVDSLGVLLHELVRRGPHRVHLGRGA